MTEVQIADEELCDIRRIARYYIKTSGSNHWFLNQVEKAISHRQRFPNSGHRRSDLLDDTLRYWLIVPYVIVYRVDGGTLTVVAVVHSSRDLARVIEEL